MFIRILDKRKPVGPVDDNRAFVVVVNKFVVSEVAVLFADLTADVFPVT